MVPLRRGACCTTPALPLSPNLNSAARKCICRCRDDAHKPGMIIRRSGRQDICLSDAPGLHQRLTRASGTGVPIRHSGGLLKRDVRQREVFGSRWSRDPREAPAGGAVAHGGAFSNECAISLPPGNCNCKLVRKCATMRHLAPNPLIGQESAGGALWDILQVAPLRGGRHPFLHPLDPTATYPAQSL